MARSLRMEFDGAIYHVTSRGNAREDIFDDGEDRNQARHTDCPGGTSLRVQPERLQILWTCTTLRSAGWQTGIDSRVEDWRGLS